MDDYLDYVIEQLAGLGAITSRKMFGGAGLYCDDLFFGLIAKSVLYLKVDETNHAEYADRDCQPFMMRSGKPSKTGYYELPVDILERPTSAVEWAQRSLEVARQNPTKKRKKANIKRKPGKSARIKLLPNLGPKSATMLFRVGIKNRTDLEEYGSVGAYLALRASGQAVSLNLLYAMEGALLDVRWDELPEPLKERLRAAVGENS